MNPLRHLLAGAMAALCSMPAWAEEAFLTAMDPALIDPVQLDGYLNNHAASYYQVVTINVALAVPGRILFIDFLNGQTMNVKLTEPPSGSYGGAGVEVLIALSPDETQTMGLLMFLPDGRAHISLSGPDGAYRIDSIPDRYDPNRIDDFGDPRYHILLREQELPLRMRPSESPTVQGLAVEGYAYPDVTAHPPEQEK